MTGSEIFWLCVVAAIAFGVGRSSMAHRIDAAEASKADAEKKLSDLMDLYNQTLSKIRSDSVLLPSLVRWSDLLQQAYDDFIAGVLYHKKRPAKKAALEVQIARASARDFKKQFEIVRNRLDLYESLAPWLADYVDLTVDELIEALVWDKKNNVAEEDNEDPIARYVPKTEWANLTVTERNQLALDRYLQPNRKRGLWSVGVDYERFVGYEYEQRGYSVEYHGATQGKEDLGIDLICRKENDVRIVQCKRLSQIKEIPVRENVIAQVYGAAEFYRMNAENLGKVTPVLVTSYVVSDTARRFAQHLNVELHENYEQTPYPMIKCNISRRTGEKIYHLPMDQQYDKVIVGDTPGEGYATTVAEAENKGFRRAFRWKGNKDGK
jgi:hypothetical protein